MENGRRPKDSQMVGDYGVEEWKDGGKRPDRSINTLDMRWIIM